MTGLPFDGYFDLDDDPDRWQALREDDHAADDYIHDRLAHEADDKRKQTKENPA